MLCYRQEFNLSKFVELAYSTECGSDRIAFLSFYKPIRFISLDLTNCLLYLYFINSPISFYKIVRCQRSVPCTVRFKYIPRHTSETFRPMSPNQVGVAVHSFVVHSTIPLCSHWTTCTTRSTPPLAVPHLSPPQLASPLLPVAHLVPPSCLPRPAAGYGACARKASGRCRGGGMRS